MSERGPFSFRLLGTDRTTRARRGRVTTPHGTFETPAFMPVGTAANVKGLLPDQVRATTSEILLCNTYHLHLRPGERLIEDLGGLHRFMNWDGPILTDSGGYQVFSLADRRKIVEGGVEFKSHIDGARCFLGPKEAMQIQCALGSDIIMTFDECMPYPVDRSYAEESLARTLRWERETLDYHPRDGRALFGIVQGGVFEDLRIQSAEALYEMPFDGYAMGGLFVGEPRDVAMHLMDRVGRIVPAESPHYVMGLGTPIELLDAVARGWDMFDCVLPTRNARHGNAFTDHGVLKLKNNRHRTDDRPIQEDCPCLACAGSSRAYLRHLFVSKEILGGILVSHHNITYLARMMADARTAIEAGQFDQFCDQRKRAWLSES